MACAPRSVSSGVGYACAHPRAVTAPRPSRSYRSCLAGLRNRRVLLDGELVCLNDEGDPDFARLRARLRSTGMAARLAARRAAATFLAFDLLHLDGRSTRELPYGGRRALLVELALDGPSWCTPRAFAADEGPALLEATRERGLEGVMMKRLNAPYLPGVRSATWVKHKHRRSENLVVTGWVPASGKQPEALLVARVGVEGSLAPAGSVSLGYHGELRERIQEALRASGLRPVRPRQRLHRVQPFLRVTVDFHGPAEARCATRCCVRSRQPPSGTSRLSAPKGACHRRPPARLTVYTP
jgi:ATP-dependent DNA ligase